MDHSFKSDMKISLKKTHSIFGSKPKDSPLIGNKEDNTSYTMHENAVLSAASAD
jgi:hypothetical protein